MRIVPDRVGVGALKAVSGNLWDLRANLMDDIVDQHGSVSSLAWFARNMPRYEKILARWGPIRTHLVTTAYSLVNGCGYCAYGHAHAMQLHYFQHTNRLFPLSEDDLLALIGSGEDAIVAALSEALVAADLADEVDWVDRGFALKNGDRKPDDQDDADLLHLAGMFDWLNACGIAGGTEPDGAHDPINKDAALRERYAAARAEAGSSDDGQG